MFQSESKAGIIESRYYPCPDKDYRRNFAEWIRNKPIYMSIKKKKNNKKRKGKEGKLHLASAWNWCLAELGTQGSKQ